MKDHDPKSPLWIREHPEEMGKYLGDLERLNRLKEQEALAHYVQSRQRQPDTSNDLPLLSTWMQ